MGIVWTRPARVIGVASWTLLAGGTGVVFLTTRYAPDQAQASLTVVLGVFFISLLVRLAMAAIAQPERRAGLLSLLAGVLLWASGSAVLNGSGSPTLTVFPAPGEWLFLAAYVAMAAYLLVDGRRRTEAAAATWLETAIICGGTACIAGGLVVTPTARHLGTEGTGLLLALLYPLIDIALLLVVTGQVALRLRGGLRASSGLLLGLGLFTVADLTFIVHLRSGRYDFNLPSIVLWGAGFALIVGNACRSRAVAPPAAGPTRGVLTMVIVSSIAATLVLAVDPHGSMRPYLLVPALGTLVAAGARLVLAVRAANRAAEAVALSLTDDLTALPNRRAALARLEDGLRDGGALGLVLLDLDGFKDINDTLGHGAGDAVLIEVAQRMRASVDPAVMVTRLGGDEFALICPSGTELALMEVTRAVLAAIRVPLEVDGIMLRVDASAGMTVQHARDTESSEMLRRADVAMYDAKRHRSGAVLYDPHNDTFSRDRLMLGEELRRGIDEDQLVLWYQPQLDVATGAICGVEALVRWQHPQAGLLSPAIFLPVARRSGLMLALSQAIGRIAVRDMTRWAQLGLHPRVAINCAPPELMSGIFLPELDAMLAAAGLEACQVTIEVTEDTFLSEPERARELLGDLRHRGFEISVDDYGTGFSSLSYLRDLPIQELKMDRSFIAAIRADARSRMIVVSTFQLADALGLRMVAEGVETQAIADDLAQLGVHVLQGYHVARPMPPEQIVDHLLGTVTSTVTTTAASAIAAPVAPMAPVAG